MLHAHVIHTPYVESGQRHGNLVKENKATTVMLCFVTVERKKSNESKRCAVNCG